MSRNQLLQEQRNAQLMLQSMNMAASDSDRIEVVNKKPKGSESTENTDEVDNTPVGMKGEAKALYQKKDRDNKWLWTTEEPEDVADAAENAETAKYAILVRKKKSYDSRKKYDLDSIIVQSPLLKQALGIALKDYPGITTTLDRLVFSAPFHAFVHRWLRLVELLDENKTKDDTTRQHLKILIDVLYEELKDAIAARNDLVKNGVITFDYLWTILEPSTLIYSTDEGKERVYMLNKSSRTTDQRRGIDMEQLQVWSVDWDGDKFGKSYEYLRNYEFEGTTKISALSAFPLEFHPRKDELIASLIMRGKLFEKFAGYHYQAYKGVALGYGRCGMIKHNIDSRVIIDCDAHNRFLPNRAVNFQTLGKAGDDLDIGYSSTGTDEEEDYGDAEDDLYADEDEDEDEHGSDVFMNTPNTDDSNKQKDRHRPLTSKELLLAVPYVRGYAVKSKTWLWFFVDQIVPIKFADNAFSALVLPSDQKRLIRAFVESQATYKDTFDDIIAGKGRGMIMLLAGPPGVGKTLTAESVAEDLKVPLYMMSAGDLGLDPSGIEESLNTVMDMVAKWNAVLLLDEADVFLEARSTSDLERNKMVSIFLRVLEYYEGILFLTTNRIKNIDDAFHSRIHVTINYPNLSRVSRLHIWQTFLGKQSRVTAEEMESLSRVDLNGRQIKNMLKTAQMLARSEKQNKESTAGQVEMRHIQAILAIEKNTTWE